MTTVIDRERLRAAGIALLISLAAALLAASPACDGLRGLSLDLMTALRWRTFGNPQPPADSPAVVVAFDEETFRTPPFDGTPTVTWTRELAPVLTALIDGGASVVGFDVVFPTSIEQSAVPFGDDPAGQETLGARLRGFDRDFLRALALGARAGKVVLGAVQHQDKPLLPAPGQRAAVGFTRNIRSLNVLSDPDDVARRVPLTFLVDGAPVPAMAAELAARATAAPIAEGLASAGAVPGAITLNFAGGADDIPTYSFADLHACLAKDPDFFRKNFAGKVVLIGTLLDVEDRKITTKRFATAPEGAYAPRCALPRPAAAGFARDSIAGVYVQATAVNNLVRRDPVVEFGRGITGLTAFGLAALAAAAALLLGPGAAVLAFVGLAAVWTTGATFAFRGAVAMPWLAPQVAALLALGATMGWRLVVSDRSLAKEIERRRAHEAEMASAAAIQRAMLPAAQPGEIAAARFDVHPFMTPAREVGGDLYDIVRLAPAHVLLSIGDVCGKGIPAALFMAITQTVLRLAVRLGDDLGAEVTAANRQLAADNSEGMFTTLFCGVLDLSTGALAWCNAGHPPALLMRRDGAFEHLRVAGPPLGVVETAKYVPKAVTLAPGDLLFLYSDGVTEAENPKAELFGSERLEQALTEARGRPARDVVAHVVRRVAEFANGAPQSDDITCMAVLRLP